VSKRGSLMARQRPRGNPEPSCSTGQPCTPPSPAVLSPGYERGPTMSPQRHTARMVAAQLAFRQCKERERLPRQASPTEKAKDGQHNNDDDDDPKPGRHVILSLGARRLYGEPIRFATCAVRTWPSAGQAWRWDRRPSPCRPRRLPSVRPDSARGSRCKRRAHREDVRHPLHGAL
jgi:hypothetical protein